MNKLYHLNPEKKGIEQVKTRMNKWLLLGLTALLLLTFPQLGTVAAAPGGQTIADGEYVNVPYQYLKDGTNNTSAADSFMQVAGSGRLVVTGGKATFTHEVNSPGSGWIVYLAYRKTGQPKATIVNETVSNHTGYAEFERTTVDASSGRIKLNAPVEDASGVIDVLMHVIVPQVPGYDHWYNAQLKIDLSGLQGSPGGTPEVTLEQLDQLITVAQSVYDTAAVGSAYGQYTSESKTLFESQIAVAKQASEQAASNPDVVAPAYSALETALKVFKESVKQADKRELIKGIEEVRALYGKVQSQGELGRADSAAREARNGDSDPNNNVEIFMNPAVSEGEFHTGILADLDSALQKAQEVVDDATAKDTKVASNVRTLRNKRISNETYFYRLQPEALPIYVLDSDHFAAEQSAFAADFAGVVHRLTNGSNSQAYGNVPFSNSDVQNVRQSVPLITGDFRLPADGEGDKAVKLVSFNGLQQPVYQLHIQSNGDPKLYTGISFLTYEVGGQTRTVYISYNYNQLESLRGTIAAAENLQAKAASGAYQQNEQAKAALALAIADAKTIAGNLAAKLPEITAADAALTAAVNSFKHSANYTVNFTAAAAVNDFSPAGAYLGDKADVSTVNGVTHAEFTVLNSSKVVVQTNSAGGRADAQVVSEDRAANTRKVKIEIPNLSALTPLWITAEGTEYEVRLNLNDADNKALSAKVAEAKNELISAVIGNQPGQYPESAKTALEQAVVSAAAEAARILGTQALSDSAAGKLEAALKTFRAARITTAPPTGPGGPTTPVPLTDGKYQISFTILKYGTSQPSVMNQYVAHPGRMLVENGVKYVYIWLKQSNEITSFSVEGSSPEVVESDPAGNTRWVRFPVSDLNTLLSGWVKIDWPEMNYFHDYDVQIKLGSYTKVTSWNGENFGPITPLPNPDTPKEPEADPKQEGPEPENPGAGTGSNEGSNVSFNDTEHHWASAKIKRAVELNIVKGYTDGMFRPNATVSRAEFAVMLGRALNFKGEEGELDFSDSEEVRPWAKALVKEALSSGIISGYEDGTFRPAKQITRSELTVMIVRALELAPEAESGLTFADAQKIPAFARGYVATAVKHGLIEGLGGNKFGGTALATRAEAVTLILRAIDLVESGDDAQ